jgi:hypothetical protein
MKQKTSSMKRTILSFGGIAGLVLGIFIVLLTLGKAGNAVWGYSSMIVAFSFIYVGVRNYRDKYNEGVISFGKALRIGLGITLVGSTLYVLFWMVDFYAFIPDFMNKYAATMVKDVQNSGLTGAALDKKLAGIKQMQESYKSPVFVFFFTYLEVMPVGIVISLIASLLLRRRNPRPIATQVIA